MAIDYLRGVFADLLDITALLDISALGDITAPGDISALGDITAPGDITALGDAKMARTYAMITTRRTWLHPIECQFSRNLCRQAA